ncbi:MAG: hypothetical protein JXB00_08750 [Bacteroidales bacterium]|nr:hypothetical protein [Bacteroidales bacterium]
MVLFLLYLLFFPVFIRLNTRTNRYYACLPGIAGINVLKKEDGWKFYYLIFFLKFSFKPFKQLQNAEIKHDDTTKTKQRRKKLPVFMIPKMISGIISNFRIKKLDCSIDTGDYPLNAQLIPVASCLSDSRVSVTINFNNKNELYLSATTRLFGLLITFIRFYMFNR